MDLFTLVSMFYVLKVVWNLIVSLLSENSSMCLAA